MGNDFEFYGEDTDEAVVKEEKGITDKVTEYTYTNLSYPCIMFDEGFSCEKHKLNVVSNMVKAGNIEKDISLYFKNASGVFKMGEIGGIQVNPFLEAVGTDSLTGYFDEDTRVRGDKLYTMCSLF